MDEYLVGHQSYAKEHALFHTWKASKYYSAQEGIKEMLIIERRQHQTEPRTKRIAALEFLVQLLDVLIEQELLDVYNELKTYLTGIGKVKAEQEGAGNSSTGETGTAQSGDSPDTGDHGVHSQGTLA